ncbi:MAG TPA: FAD-dependent oxidoreductase [Thermomicrobiales bacterium]|nr:FAD-dependent oxidoreductase [Thermomicrobiales bacterium]
MRESDVAVVGAGPAGIGAALAAARNGVSVVLIDENSAVGGHLRWTLAPQTGFEPALDGLTGIEIAGWAAGALADAGVGVLTDSVAWGLFEENVLGVATPDASFRLRARAVVVATGSTDSVWPFPGWQLPGVMTATAALRAMHLDRVLPGFRCVVLGAGSLAEVVASDLTSCGAAVVLRAGNVDGLVAGGDGAVAWVESDGQRTACDAVILAFGRQPDAELALQAQAALAYSPNDGVFVPWRDETLATRLAGVYVAGDAGGVGTAARSYVEGLVAGAAASGGDGLTDALERLREIAADQVPDSPLPAIADATLVCRCEEVSAASIRTAINTGAISLNDIKRRTRAGMGICQGIYCHRTVAQMLSTETGIPLDTIVPMTARPPARLLSMAAMADLET